MGSSCWKIVGAEVGGTGLLPFLGLSRTIAPLDMIFFMGESVLTAGPRRVYSTSKANLPALQKNHFELLNVVIAQARGRKTYQITNTNEDRGLSTKC